jgi:hypothetical protein
VKLGLAVVFVALISNISDNDMGPVEVRIVVDMILSQVVGRPREGGRLHSLLRPMFLAAIQRSLITVSNGSRGLQYFYWCCSVDLYKDNF